VGPTDFVVAIGADQQQMRHLGVCGEMFEHLECRSVHHCRSSRNSARGCSGRANTPRNRRTLVESDSVPPVVGAQEQAAVANDQSELRDEVDHKLAICAHCIEQHAAPSGYSASFLLRSWRTSDPKAWARVEYGMSRLY